jgi:hypothetical protein
MSCVVSAPVRWLDPPMDASSHTVCDDLFQNKSGLPENFFV